MRAHRALARLGLAALLAAGCARGAGDPAACDAPVRAGTLPPHVHESSGVALGRSRTGVLWTHNDSGGEPVVFAVDTAGRLLGETRVSGAENVDWEDVAAGPCPAGSCLFVGDIGDNQARRETVVVYRVAEPAPGDAATTPAERFPVRYPGGPRDAEALFVLPGGELYIVTKGRTDPPTLYRYPPPLRPDTVVELEPVQQLGGQPALPIDMVTGAGASPDGQRVVVRTYGSLRVYRFVDARLAPLLDPPLDLLPLEEPQGEAVDIENGGTIWLTTEAESGGGGFLARVRCRLD